MKEVKLVTKAGSHIKIGQVCVHFAGIGFVNRIMKLKSVYL